jgi:hypothetical protein
MTPQTDIDADRNAFTRMTVLATGSVWFMSNIANQTAVVTPMGVVTGSAAFQFGRVAGMFLLNRLGRMAGQAKLVGLFDEQGRVGRLMRIMAGSAFPFCIGCMGKFELFGQTGVAGKAGFCRTCIEQIVLIRGMRIVTGKAFPFPNRTVDNSLLQPLGQFLVTGITQLGNRILEKTGIPGNMGVMAGETIPAGDRLMLHLFLEGGTVMTGEAVNGGLGHRRVSKEQNCHCQHGQECPKK